MNSFILVTLRYKLETEQMKHISEIQLKDFLFEYSLYQEVQISDADNLDFLDSSEDIDYYNPELNEITTFKHKKTHYYDLHVENRTLIYGRNNPDKYNLFFQYGGYCSFIMECARREIRIIFTFYLNKKKSTLQKIGQYPSVASFQEHNFLKDFKDIILEEDARTLSKANGLFAHGIGAGALVYLRRVFERIIFQTWYQNKEACGITEEDFKRKRMDEKIETLSNYLPQMILQNKAIYGVLSKGIHELEEEECMTIFPRLCKSFLQFWKKSRHRIKRISVIKT